jgi:hypothetical protein
MKKYFVYKDNSSNEVFVYEDNRSSEVLVYEDNQSPYYADKWVLTKDYNSNKECWINIDAFREATDEEILLILLSN